MVTKNEIQKATIKNDRCNVSFKENTENDINVVSKECGGIIHKDLLQAMNRLKVHLVALSEQPEASLIKQSNIDDFDLSLLDNYTVTGYSLGGSDENAGVTIVGQKLLKSGKVLNLVSPFTKYEDDYEFSSELGTDVEMCNYEVKEYVFSGKFGVKQETFDFDKPADADIQMGIAAEGVVSMSISSRSRKSKKMKETAESF